MLKRKLNLQYFAEENPQENEEQPQEQPTAEEPEPKPEDERKFTQAEIDDIIAKRLERERKKRDEAIQKERDEAERKKLEEANEFKSLYEKTQSELDAIKSQALDAKKDALLAKAGYTDEQIDKYRKYLDGDTDDELATALESLKADIPPKAKYVDPSTGNHEKKQPEQKDLREEGKSLYQRLKASGKIRR